MKKVLHVTRGYLAGVASNISKAVEYYFPGNFSFKWVPTRLYDSDLVSFNYRVAEADIIHWHNWIDHKIILGTSKTKKHIIHYHSEPMNTDILDPVRVKEKLPFVKQLVVAQYQAALNTYKDCQPIRNVVYIPGTWIDIDAETYSNGGTDKIKIAFSPSSANFNIWQNKDPARHMSLIQRVSRILRNQGVEVDIELITNTTYRECIWRKSRCDIVMDECVTPSFHLSSLEGLALGKMTVCWVDDKVNSVLTNITGADSNPFHGDYIGWLEDILIEKLTGGREYIRKQGMLASEWYKKYWNPRDIAADYCNVYTNL